MDWPHGKWAGQDCKTDEWMAGNDPFRGRKVWSQTSRRLPITVQTIPKLVIANIRPTAHSGARPVCVFGMMAPSMLSLSVL